MNNKITLIILLFLLTVKIYSYEDDSINLIREYYRTLESENLPDQIDLSFPSTQFIKYKSSCYFIIPEKPSNISLINIEKISDNNYEAILVVFKDLKNKISTDSYAITYKVKVTTDTNKDGFIYIKSLTESEILNPFTKEQMIIIKYYELLERRTTLSDAYFMAKKSYSLDKFKSWYNYNRSFTDINFETVNYENVSFKVSISVYNPSIYKPRNVAAISQYNIDMVIRNDSIIYSNSEPISYLEKEFYLIDSDYGVSFESISDNLDREKMLNKLLDEERLSIDNLYDLYTKSNDQAFYINYLNKLFKSNSKYSIKRLLDSDRFGLRYIIESFFSEGYSTSPGRDREKQLNIINLCLDADIDTTIQAGAAPGRYPYSLGDVIIVTGDNKLIKKFYSIVGKMPSDAVLKAAQIGRLDLIDLLIELGANIDGSGQIDLNNNLYGAIGYNNKEVSLIEYSIINNNKEALLKAIEYGADLKSEYKSELNIAGDYIIEQYNLSGLAVKYKNKEILKILLDNGAEMPKGYREYQNPLYRAIKNNSDLDYLALYYNYNLEDSELIKIYTKNNIIYTQKEKLSPLKLAVKLQREDFIEFHDGQGKVFDDSITVEEFKM